MKYIFLTVLLIFTFSFQTISAQQNHFIYFQTDNKQPFYIKIDNKIFSSSSSGYLILPKLQAGNSTIRIGSPKNEWPEQLINYKLDKDAGFVIKKFGEKGWGLFNLQSLEVIIAGNDMSGVAPAQEIKDDDFSKMLANVVNDSTIKQKDIVAKEEVKEATKEIIPAPVETMTPQASPEEIQAPVINSTIKRNLKIKNKNGMELVYIDEYNNKKDTIRIFIPVERTNEKEKIKSPEPVLQIDHKTDSSSLSILTDSVQINSQTNTAKNIGELQAQLDQSLAIGQGKDTAQESIIKDSAEIVKENKSVKEDKIEFLPAKSGMINPDCNGYASENDFLKLRRKMAAEANEVNMINVAKKIFKSKCFTTEYIKNLSALFLKDEGKYNFFDAAYPYVSDTGPFSTLENQLTDPYYIKRFKAMIH